MGDLIATWWISAIYYIGMAAIILVFELPSIAFGVALGWLLFA